MDGYKRFETKMELAGYNREQIEAVKEKITELCQNVAKAVEEVIDKLKELLSKLFSKNNQETEQPASNKNQAQYNRITRVSTKRYNSIRDVRIENMAFTRVRQRH